MAQLLARQQADGPEWGRNLQKRLPRHQDPEDPDWFLSLMVAPERRWYEAEQTMLKHRSEGVVMKMERAFENIRQDIGHGSGGVEPPEVDDRGTGTTSAGAIRCSLPIQPQAEPIGRLSNPNRQQNRSPNRHLDFRVF